MHGILKNKMAAKMVMPTSVSFLEMPCEILCCLSIPANTLRKILEFFLQIIIHIQIMWVLVI
jgi:hypothetical protein